MTHRAESILSAITTTLTDLTTTGEDVARGHVYPFMDEVENALTVSMSGETPFSPPNMAYQDEVLRVEITAHTKAADETLDTALNVIAAEVYAAMLADQTQGLAYVIDTRWQGRQPPQRDIAEKPVTTQVLQFDIIYRHSYTSTES
jgi:hypothetical protein